jgi:hypothetical protein
MYLNTNFLECIHLIETAWHSARIMSAHAGDDAKSSTIDCFGHALMCVTDVLNGVQDVAKLVLSYATPCDGYSKKPHDVNRIPVVAVSIRSEVALGNVQNLPVWTTIQIRPLSACGQPGCLFHECDTFTISVQSFPVQSIYYDPIELLVIQDASFQGIMAFLAANSPENHAEIQAVSIPSQMTLAIRSRLVWAVPRITGDVICLYDRQSKIMIRTYDDDGFIGPSLRRIFNESRSAHRNQCSR